MLITPHYNDEVNFATPCYNEDKISRNLQLPTSKIVVHSGASVADRNIFLGSFAAYLRDYWNM